MSLRVRAPRFAPALVSACLGVALGAAAVPVAARFVRKWLRSHRLNFASFHLNAAGSIGVQREAGDKAVTRKAMKSCKRGAPPGVWKELSLAGIADLDGDGIDEALWTWAREGESAGQPLSISWFTGTRFETQTLASYSDTGSDTFLDPAQCGRSKTQWHTEDDPCAAGPD